MAQQQPARRKAQFSKASVSIPDKLYFRIGDVARLCSLPAYVLRFWETEFPQLKPNKGGTGQRLYRKRDVEMVLEIKHLLYGERFTIAGARQILTEKRRLSGVAIVAQESAVANHRHAGEKAVLSDARSRTADRGPAKMAKAPSPKSLPEKPKIKELKAEMRELLTLLGSDSSERKPHPASARRESKKMRRPEEPTLF